MNEYRRLIDETPTVIASVLHGHTDEVAHRIYKPNFGQIIVTFLFHRFSMLHFHTPVTTL